MFAVICREAEPAQWSVNRKIETVRDGDVVLFLDKADADHFVDQGRAEHISDEDLAAALAAGEGETEDGDIEDDGHDTAPEPVKAAAKPKKGRR